VSGHPREPYGKPLFSQGEKVVKFLFDLNENFVFRFLLLDSPSPVLPCPKISFFPWTEEGERETVKYFGMWQHTQAPPPFRPLRFISKGLNDFALFYPFLSVVFGPDVTTLRPLVERQTSIYEYPNF
jgi:hypothetical protein